MKQYKPGKDDIKDETIIEKSDAWEFSVSKSRKRLYINTIHYHPFKLELTRDDLQKLLDVMDEMIKI
jgi:hypothetical protein